MTSLVKKFGYFRSDTKGAQVRVLEYLVLGAGPAGLQFRCRCQSLLPGVGPRASNYTGGGARGPAALHSVLIRLSHTLDLEPWSVPAVPRADSEARRRGARLNLLWLQDRCEDAWRSLTRSSWVPIGFGMLTGCDFAKDIWKQKSHGSRRRAEVASRRLLRPARA